MKFLKKILLLLFLAFVIAQFFGPEKNQGNLASIEPFLVETNPPEDVKLVLKTACFDCHSDYTSYPWYNNITPVNYWMAGHVDHGKEELNFSNWSNYSLKRKDRKLDEVIELVEKREMPLNSYTWTHNDAKLTDKQINNIVSWASSVREEYSKNKPVQ